MLPFLVLLAVCVVSAAVIFLYPAWRRRRVLAAPFPQPWRNLLEARMPLYGVLDDGQRERLEAAMRLFLATKRFHGCAGLEVEEDMQVLIAAQACLLLLGRRGGVFPALRHILVYPGAFRYVGDEQDEGGVVSRVSEERLGESWHEGKVILSWDDVEYDLDNPDDGVNVVLHEFAHQLDGESGGENGTPPLHGIDGEQWVAVMTREYEALAAAEERGEETFLDPYGATAPAEFFAVLTETYFELPRELERQHPDLFRLLHRYYVTDPRAWMAPPV